MEFEGFEHHFCPLIRMISNAIQDWKALLSHESSFTNVRRHKLSFFNAGLLFTLHFSFFTFYAQPINL